MTIMCADCGHLCFLLFGWAKQVNLNKVFKESLVCYGGSLTWLTEALEN